MSSSRSHSRSHLRSRSGHGQVRSGQVRSGQVRSGQVRSEREELSHLVMACSVKRITITLRLLFISIF